MENNKPIKAESTTRIRPPRFARIAGLTIIGVISAVLFALVFGLLVKWLWNALMPGIFNLGEIGYWQAVGLIILAKLIFGHFGQPYSRRVRERTDRFHHSTAPGHFCDGEGSFKDRFRKWNHYRQYWEDEGKAAYDQYVERKENARKENGGHDL